MLKNLLPIFPFLLAGLSLCWKPLRFSFPPWTLRTMNQNCLDINLLDTWRWLTHSHRPTDQIISFFLHHPYFQHLNHSCCSGLPPNCQIFYHRAVLSSRCSSLAGVSTLSGSVNNSPRGSRYMMVYKKSLSATYLVCSSVTGFECGIEALWNLFLHAILWLLHNSSLQGLSRLALTASAWFHSKVKLWTKVEFSPDEVLPFCAHRQVSACQQGVLIQPLQRYGKVWVPKESHPGLLKLPRAYQLTSGHKSQQAGFLLGSVSCLWVQLRWALVSAVGWAESRARSCGLCWLRSHRVLWRCFCHCAS